MRRTKISAIIGSISVSLTVAFTAPVSASAQELPPHLIQTVSEQDIFEGMLALGYLETPVLETQDCDKAYENVKDCVVRIQMGNAHGSGIIWNISSERVVIVTNKHVLDYWKEESGYVHFPQGYDMDAQFLGTSEDYDVGFIAVDGGQFTYEELQKIRCARVSQDDNEGLKQGDMMFLADSGSLEEDARYYVGIVEDPYQYIEDLDAYMLYAHCYAKAGMSGGGTFDGQGNLIGMTTAGTAQGEAASVPVQHIDMAYEEVMEDKF